MLGGSQQSAQNTYLVRSTAQFKELCTAAGKHYGNNKYKSKSVPLLSQAVKAILESIRVNSFDDNMLTLPGGPERDPWGF